MKIHAFYAKIKIAKEPPSSYADQWSVFERESTEIPESSLQFRDPTHLEPGDHISYFKRYCGYPHLQLHGIVRFVDKDSFSNYVKVYIQADMNGPLNKEWNSQKGVPPVIADPIHMRYPEGHLDVIQVYDEDHTSEKVRFVGDKGTYPTLLDYCMAPELYSKKPGHAMNHALSTDRIICAAMCYTDNLGQQNILMGFDYWDKFMQQTYNGLAIKYPKEDFKPGFITSEGRWVDPAEASTIVKLMGQYYQIFKNERLTDGLLPRHLY